MTPGIRAVAAVVAALAGLGSFEASGGPGTASANTPNFQFQGVPKIECEADNPTAKLLTYSSCTLTVIVRNFGAPGDTVVTLIADGLNQANQRIKPSCDNVTARTEPGDYAAPPPSCKVDAPQGQVFITKPSPGATLPGP